MIFTVMSNFTCSVSERICLIHRVERTTTAGTVLAACFYFNSNSPPDAAPAILDDVPPVEPSKAAVAKKRERKQSRSIFRKAEDKLGHAKESVKTFVGNAASWTTTKLGDATEAAEDFFASITLRGCLLVALGIACLHYVYTNFIAPRQQSAENENATSYYDGWWNTGAAQDIRSPQEY